MPAMSFFCMVVTWLQTCRNLFLAKVSVVHGPTYRKQLI